MFSSFLLYAFFQTLCGTWYRTQNLKKRYNAEWGLVTGSSSGEAALCWGGGRAEGVNGSVRALRAC